MRHGYYRRGVIYYRMGDYPRAVEDLRQYLRLSPNAIEGYEQLFLCYLEMGKIAFWITATAALFAGDFPLAVFKTLADSLHVSTTGLGRQLLALVLIRPESIALLAMGVFYLWDFHLRAYAVHAENAAASNLHA